MIFYFSATGNSRHVAERIAAAMGDVAVSIAECGKSRTFAFEHPDQSVGIVSPTYAWGLPTVVREFLRQLALGEKPAYLWFAATYGTTPGQSGRFAQDILAGKGLSLAAKFSVRMPDTWTPLFDLSDKDKVRRINEAAEVQIDQVIDLIRNQTTGDFMQREISLPLVRTIHRLEYDSMRQTRRLTVEDSCVGCGLCVRNCPVGAIEMRGGRPVWVEQRCAMCLGCLHRCPKFAIQYGRNTKRHGQYVYPVAK